MRFVKSMALVIALMVPATAFAAGDQRGVYVAPKLVYGLSQAAGTKAHADFMGTSGSLRINDTDSVFGGSIALGYDFGKNCNAPIRTELEYAGFSKAEAKKNFSDPLLGSMSLKQSFNVQTLFANAYWDINTKSQFTPYVGGGLGMGIVKTKGTAGVSGFSDSTGSRTVTDFAWNIGAGLGYDITDNWALDVGYRFVGLGSVKTKTYDDGVASLYGKTNNLFQHQISLGLRYTF